MTDSELQRAVDQTMVSILNANALQVFEGDEMQSPNSCTACGSDSLHSFADSKCHVSKDGFVTTKSRMEKRSTPVQTFPQHVDAKSTKTGFSNKHGLPSDRVSAQRIEEAQEDFNKASDIIGSALRSDMLAIDEVESYLNDKGVFLEARKDNVHWEQDHAHDQTRFHFVLCENKNDKSGWLASDARYVRTRLADLVGNLSNQLKKLKTNC